MSRNCPQFGLNDEVKIEYSNGKKPRIRKVVSRSNMRVTGKYPSWKVGRMLHWESLIEKDAFILHDAWTEITAFSEQPAKLSFNLDGKYREHFPDLLVETQNALSFVEVKTDDDADRLEIRERTEYLSKVLPSYGYQYKILLESEIRQQPRLKNAQFLVRHGRYPVSFLKREAFRRKYEKKNNLCWGDVTNNSNCNLDVFQVSRLILEGYLNIPLNCEWDEATPIRFITVNSIGSS